MVVGQGFLARNFENQFSNREDIIIFASGVANSQEKNEAAFVRERLLLESALKCNKKIVYFSTCSVYDRSLAHTPYVKHKQLMESLVVYASQHVIFRLPQVIGRSDNPHTLTNYLYDKIANKKHFDIWKHARRHLIDISDVVLICQYLLSNNESNQKTIDIACPFSISVTALVELFEQIIKKKAHYSLIETGSAYPIDSSFASHVAVQMDIQFDNTYIERVLRKYYG